MDSKGVYIQELTKIYIDPKGNQIKAVDNISVNIKPGEFVTLLGPSGCGKTTTLRMIAGFEIPSSGNIYLGDKKINDLPPDKRDTAMVFQSYALFPHYNVFDNIAYGLKIKKLPAQEIRNKVSKILETIGLQGMEKRFPNQLSGGQQQRIALARALIMEPGVLLFDEPLSNLDAKLRVYMRSEIRRIQRQFGITAIYVTHDQSEAMSLSDKIIIMNEGIIEQIGTPLEIYYSPKTEFVADFIGIANFLEAKIISKKSDKAIILLQGKEIEVAYSGDKKPGEKCKLIIRPETVKISKTGQFKGIVKSSTFMGSYQEYTVECGSHTVQIHDVNPKVKTVFSEGEDVGIELLPENIHII
ncbi:MAG: ABC transporter ATP-binding protein [Tepidanaerobacter acetatoxydans]|jgi:iron(III) transport system ATP-binding protein|uniref:ABC transporter ATP-binding protein n=1 Tax=Tepidanaerobacter TaxID=499228 RepID=UPI000AA5E719|nr:MULTISPECIES: ABC transporter ATP-binding protein [Tepidanaerobacter]NLU10156.1 ABC transporter ATP-binding protein [Tepidanaerobacter acetatoxydans]